MSIADTLFPDPPPEPQPQKTPQPRTDVRAPHVPGRYGVCCTRSGSSWGVYERRAGLPGRLVATVAAECESGYPAERRAVMEAQSLNEEAQAREAKKSRRAAP